MTPAPRTSLGELAAVFGRLGTISFGGPVVHVAMMEDEVVARRQWLTREEFLDYVGATNLIPGPNSTELAIHIGYSRRGWPGLVVAGVSFILPAAVIVAAIGWLYLRVGTVPAAAGLLYGIKPVVIAIVLQALWRLARTALASWQLGLLGAVAVLAFAGGVHELLVLGGSGFVMGVWRGRPRDGPGRAVGSWGWMPVVAGGMLSTGAPVVAGTVPFSLAVLGATFVKIGAVLFGSGYVLLAFLRQDFVERLGWLTEGQLLDAVAVGQMTPGPIFTAATFVGYLLGGGWGAVVATVGIFLPAFVFVALTGVIVRRIRHSPAARAVIAGVNVASLALMAVVTWQLARSALVDPPTIVVALASAAVLLRSKLNSAWLVLAGAMVGVARMW
ncbi:MAG: chromate efflux transporter [Gemmatimonadetes bacterium]|nr:chromate efflux transporter [Gemmatimonadota bacterium]